jgi:hypothetical protein
MLGGIFKLTDPRGMLVSSDNCPDATHYDSITSGSGPTGIGEHADLFQDRSRRSEELYLRVAGNETFLVLAGVGEVVAGPRWWSCAQPPAHRVRPLQGRKPKPRSVELTPSTLMSHS